MKFRFAFKVALLIWVSAVLTILITKNKPNKSESIDIYLENDYRLLLTAELTGEENLSINHSGYTKYQSQLVKTGFAAPSRVLKSGFFVWKGKKIQIDVKGLGDPWMQSSNLTRDFIFVDSDNNDSSSIKLFVCFAKGGVFDYWVEWLIQDETSIRLSINDCGDDYPSWVK
jgi:hypothetical protein